MKIKIQTNKTTAKTGDIKTRIINKLDALLPQRFFKWEDSKIACSGCSNVKLHNRIVILLALFTDGNHNKFHCYTSFGDVIKFGDFVGYDILAKLESFVDSIDLENNVIEIE